MKLAPCLLLVVLLCAVPGCASSPSPDPTVFVDALEECELWDAPIMKIGDKGHTLTLDGFGTEQSAGLTVSHQMCILNELDAPDSVISHIEQTTALDGRQTEAWGDISMSWTYHPDRGLDAVLTVK